jgi:peptidoglycan hydrolase-like protein with peptidoglycan-binding domain
MHDAAGHLAIVVGAGVAAYAMALAVGFDSKAPTAPAEATAVVIVPPRPVPAAAPAPIKPPVPQPAVAPMPRDGQGSQGSIARQLQGELKRVGCYNGELNGVWTTSTRLAMQNFTERVNARLPIDKPDYILLSLVQSQQKRVCEGPETADAGPARTPPAATVAPPAVAAVAPRLVAPPVQAARPPAKIERESSAPVNSSAQPPPLAPAPVLAVRAAPPEDAERLARNGEPIPPAGVYERRGRRAVRRGTWQQVYARSVFRSLQQAAKSLPLPLQ